MDAIEESAASSAGLGLESKQDNQLPAPARQGFGADRNALKIVIDLRDPEQLSLDVAVGGVEPGSRSTGGLLGARGWELALKRAVDLLGASLMLLLALPVVMIASLAIKLSSPGPVLYLSDRVGQGGETFRFAKFRTMTVGADGERSELAAYDLHSGSPIFKVRDDPRVTPVGRLLRRLSIDEIPQLVHVLSGRMSLVGPRPPLPEEVEVYGQHECRRLLVKPGLTCIWQVSGRSDLDFDTWVAMDLEYVQNWSLWLDLKLLARTLPAVVAGRGAY